jgi:DnaJ homolog subfamily B member 4
MKDYYKILGITKTATDKEITKAFRSLSMKYHPDRPKGSEAKFKEINEAHEILSDPAKRVQYNQGVENPMGPKPEDGNFFQETSDPHQNTFRFTTHRTNTPSGFNFSQFTGGNPFGNGFFGAGNTFENVFDTQNRFSFNDQQTEHVPEKQILNLSLEEMYRGGNQKISYAKQVKANNKKYNIPETIVFKIPPKCPVNKAFKLPIPGKTEHHGEQFIIIIVKPHKHAHYKFRSNSIVDLETTVSLNLKDSLVGFKLKLDGIDGEKIEVIEHEIIDPRVPYKLVNKGYVDKVGKRGDLYVIFDIKYPTELTSIQKKLLKSVL